MKKEFCTYEISIKLKELDFDEDCLASYFVFGNGKAINGIYGQTEPELFITSYNKDDYNVDEKSKELNMYAYHVVEVPLWQQTIEWLRKKYKIFISINHTIGKQSDETNFLQWNFNILNFVYGFYSSEEYENYEDARENAILKAIELCQEKKN